MGLDHNRAARIGRVLQWLLGGVVLLVSAAHLLTALGVRGFPAVAMGAMGALCLTCLPHLMAAKCDIEKSALQLLLMSAAMALAHLFWMGAPGMAGHDHGTHTAMGSVGQHGAAMLSLIALELAALALASVVMRINRSICQESALPTT